MKKNRLIILAVLVTVFAMLLTGCDGNNEKNETTLSETEISTTQELPVTEVKETTTEKSETTTEVTTEKKSIEEVAKEVINGEWGSGEERRKNLEDAGYDYDEVQAAVNRSVPKQETAANKETANSKDDSKEKTTQSGKKLYGAGYTKEEMEEFAKKWDDLSPQEQLAILTTPNGAIDMDAFRIIDPPQGPPVYF